MFYNFSMKKKSSFVFILSLILMIIFYGYNYLNKESLALPSEVSVPKFNGYYYIEVNGNVPLFSDDIDSLGRAGVAIANIGKDLMPTEKRGSIGMIKPSGWHTVKYDIIDGKYLYNRCHLIGYQLTGENANPKNLITCTRQMNTKGMLDFENKIADYIKDTGNHVLYRVTPIYEDNNLLASGVTIEAKSVEDNGKGILFNVFVYNIQNGIEIDYKTGESSLKE